MTLADSNKKSLPVVCALIFRNNKLLVCQRSSGPRAGLWEFPGGKIKSGETPFQALVRELKEELSIDVFGVKEWQTVEHEYPDIYIELNAWKVTAFNGELIALEHRSLKWVEQNELGQIDLCAADALLAVLLNDSPVEKKIISEK